MPLKPVKTKDRFKRIKNNPRSALKYAQQLNRRTPELEPVILKDATASISYAYSVLKQRWPEAEPLILKNASDSVWYAENVLKKRWPEAEPLILKNSNAAVYYASGVLKKRWPEAEPIIKQNKIHWKLYKVLISSRNPKAFSV